jgi:hypothetical protein
MLFSEEMTSLSNRFRDVTVTLDGPASIPAGAPPDWLQRQANGAVVRFVHSGYAGLGIPPKTCATDRFPRYLEPSSICPYVGRTRQLRCV